MRIGQGEFLLGDCFEHMAALPDASVDMILCDLPYGTTACAWDAVLPFDALWKEYWRVTKPNTAIVLTASQPFTAALVMSQPLAFRHDWVWEKTAATGGMRAKFSPLKAHESVLVFGLKTVKYNAQKTMGHKRIRRPARIETRSDVYGGVASYGAYDSTERYPRSVLEFAKDKQKGSWHPTQKPVALFEYLIRTYTDAGQVVLDNTAGSGTTAIAAENAGRKWICIERDHDYYAKAVERVRRHVNEDLL